MSLSRPRRTIAGCFAAAVLLAAALSVAGATAGTPETETFFVVVYGSRRTRAIPRRPTASRPSRRFAARPGADPLVELHHINWFSRGGHETGVPEGLATAGDRPIEPEARGESQHAEALLLARRLRVEGHAVGAVRIEGEFYERALRHIDLLEGRVPGRQVLYMQLDGVFREGPVVAPNCIHAISDIDRDEGPLRTGLAYGAEAARKVALHFRALDERGRA